jgi:hypothetical protein
MEAFQPRFDGEGLGIRGAKSSAPDPQGLPKRGFGPGRLVAVQRDLDVGEAVERERDFRMRRPECRAIKWNRSPDAISRRLEQQGVILLRPFV